MLLVVGLAMPRDIRGHAVVVTTRRHGVGRLHYTMVFMAPTLIALDHVAYNVVGMVSTNPSSIKPRSLF